MANQYESPKRGIMLRLAQARECLVRAAEHRDRGASGPHAAAVRSARFWLGRALHERSQAPASTRRRWKSGR